MAEKVKVFQEIEWKLKLKHLSVRLGLKAYEDTLTAKVYECMQTLN